MKEEMKEEEKKDRQASLHSSHNEKTGVRIPYGEMEEQSGK